MFRDRIRELLASISAKWLGGHPTRFNAENTPAELNRIAKVAAKGSRKAPRSRVHKPKDPPRPASNM